MARGIPGSKSDAAAEYSKHDHVDVPVTGDVGVIARPDREIVTADGIDMDYAAALAFNEELVDVVVHESTEPNASPLVDTYVNGVPQRFIRGQTQRVKRKFVEVLARAKQTGIKTVVDMSNGEPVNRIHRHTGLRYPFSVQHDPNPNGAAWLRNILAQG